MSQQRLLTAAEAAAYLGVTVGTLANWRYERRGPSYIKVGQLVRYRVTDLDAWAAGRTVELDK